VLGIAYQDNKGKWKGMRNVQADPTGKTVSVNTTHFSDWTVYETIFLVPKSDVILETRQSLTLQVMEVTPLAPTMEELNKEEYYLEEPYPVPNPVTWRLVNGPNNGSINAAAAPASATYQAPGMVPVSDNPALVEAKVDLKSLGYLLLLRNITIVEPIQPGIHLRIDGGNFRHFNTTTSFVEGSSYVHSDGDYPYDVHEVSFRINGGHAKGKGTWAWNDQSGTDEETSFEYIVKKPGPYTSYAPFYSSSCPDNDRHVSPGDIRIIEYKKDAYGKTWATGTFFIQQSTPFIENVTCHTMTRQIQGVFKLRVD
jgi:hypothetical protein